MTTPEQYLDTYMSIVQDAYAKSQPGPPREAGLFLIFTQDAPKQAPRVEVVGAPDLQYAPTSDPGYDYSWLRHLKVG